METIETPVYKRQMDYAGFWLRLAAHIIDHLLVGFVLGIFVSLIMLVLGISFGLLNNMDNSANQVLVITFSSIVGLIAFVGTWLYYALLESSSYQGTPGKIILNLKVTDMDGNKISFAKATGRFFGKLISAFIVYIGYIMIGITEKKQGLHDLLAGCLVVRK
jgi:uncharacterized RDD family membrane protein YckC